MTCIRGNDGERLLQNEHLTICSADSCPGCAPCPHRHCHVCTRTHLTDEPQTCPNCTHRIRTNLNRLVDLAALAQQRLGDYWPPVSPGTPTGAAGNESSLPGGDLISLLGPGSRATANPRRDLDERAGDPESIAAELAFYADDWRAELNPDTDQARTLPPRLVDVTGYLDQHLTWAAQHYGPIDEFAAVVRGLRDLLETELRDGTHIIRGAPCLACNTALTRHAAPPRPCQHTHIPDRRTEPDGTPEPWDQYDHRVTAWYIDHLTCNQGGLPDDWTCPRCRRVYTPAQYRNAVAAGTRAFAPALPATDLTERFGIKPATIRKLAQRGAIRKRGTDPTGRMLYDVDDVRQHAS